MPVLTSNKILIHCPIAVVYEFVANMENFGKWFPKVLEIRSANSLEPDSIGKAYIETVKVPFRGLKHIKLKVVQSQKNSLFVTEGNFHPLLPRMTINFSEQANKTTVVIWRMESRNNGTIFNLLLLPLYKFVLKGRAQKGVQNLKELLEKIELKKE